MINVMSAGREGVRLLTREPAEFVAEFALFIIMISIHSSIEVNIV